MDRGRQQRRLHHLETITQVVSESGQADGREKVDAEAEMGNIPSGEDALKVDLEVGLSEPRSQTRNPIELGQVLEEKLEEDAARRRRVRLSQPNALQDCPGNGVRLKEMAKDLGDVSDAIGLHAMGRVVKITKAPLKILPPQLINLAEALGEQSVKL